MGRQCNVEDCPGPENCPQLRNLNDLSVLVDENPFENCSEFETELLELDKAVQESGIYDDLDTPDDAGNKKSN